MPKYTKLNLKTDVEDMAVKHNQSGLQSRFARQPLEQENAGVTLLTFEPDYHQPFGHRHNQEEEVYILLEGSLKLKLDDEILDLQKWDAVRIPPPVMRAIHAGPDGAELLIIGAPNTPDRDFVIEPGWWKQ